MKPNFCTASRNASRNVVVSCGFIFITATPSFAAPPGPVDDLRLTRTTRAASWASVPGATVYHLHRGDRPSLPDLVTTMPDSCRIGSFAVPESGPVLDIDPPLGDLHWYQVVAANLEGEGPAGPGQSLEAWGGCCGETAFADEFDGVDGDPWHPRWSGQFEVDASDLTAGAGRFRPRVSFYSLARLYSHAELMDAEVTFRVRFDDIATQGVGFYVRSNGGYLQATTPHGQGYAVFVEGFRATPGIGIWKEEDGNEIDLNIRFDPTLDLRDDVDYRVRFRVTQLDPTTTRLQARIWPEAMPEPTAWQVEHDDTTTVLQGLSGGIAVDSWSSITPSTPGNPTPQFVHIDDIRVRRLCDPTAGADPIETLEESFQFTEGPKWHDGALLFSDIQADTIYRFDAMPPATIYRNPSARANGLGADTDGVLLACEHAGRRLARGDGSGPASTVVDRFQGLRFNSPNDLAVRGDGTVFFSDPPYGLVSPGDRELPFNGLFRLVPDGELTAEWQGDPLTTGPNGVLLSPDQRRLYLADSEAGTVTTFDVAPDGSLSGERLFAAGLIVPDGLCGDMAGNVYVATSSGIAVFAPDGTPWGLLPVPRPAANCGFGGVDRRSLFVTARQGLYRVRLAQPGLR